MASRQEIAVLIKAIKTAYPRFNFFSNSQTFNEELNVWLQMLQDLDYKRLEIAVYKHISTNDFPPSIANIRKLATETVTESMQDWSSAYDLMQRAIRRFGGYREIEAIEWISEQDKLAGEITRRLGFRSLCESINEIADRANFREAYNSMSSKQKTYNQIPRNVLDQERQLVKLFGGNNELRAGS